MPRDASGRSILLCVSRSAASGDFLGRLYRRFGAAYPTGFVVVDLLAAYPVGVAGVGIFSVYYDMSTSDFVQLVLWTWAVSTVAIAISVTRAHRRLEPVRAWIRGPRTPEQTVEAWRAAVALSLDVWPRVWWQQPFMLVVGVTAGAGVILELSWWEAAVVFGATWIVVGYSATLDYLTIETGLRPVVADIARELPPEFGFGRAELPLQWKLLATLPLINVITGFVVGGVTSPDDEFASVVVNVLLASAVAFTASLLIVLRLTRSLLAPVDDLVEAAGRVERGELTVKVPVTTSDELGRLARAFNKMVAGLAERERLREAFGTYLDRDVAEHILSEGTNLDGEDVDVTLMFIDVRDFTGFAERSQARDVVAALNRLFDVVVPVIHEHAGHVDKFVGDGLLAVFGAPRRQPDHADRALRAACEIASAVEERLGGELEVGIGLNSGNVLAGNVGGAGRYDFTVIGDAVNVAARVEAATRQTGDRVLLAESVRSQLRTETQELERRPAVTLKGKTDPVDLYAPVASRDAAAR